MNAGTTLLTDGPDGPHHLQAVACKIMQICLYSLVALFVLLMPGCTASMNSGSAAVVNSQTTSAAGDISKQSEDRIDVVNYPNGQKHTECTIRNGLRHGLCREWSTKGKIIKEGSYANGKQVGVWRIYHENGKIKVESEMQNGKSQGLYREWYPNGQLLQEGMYEGGKLAGEWKSYNEKGIQSGLESYSKGVPSGTWIWYDDTGFKIREGAYTQGQRDGQWITFTKDKKKHIKNYHGGVLQNVKMTVLCSGLSPDTCNNIQSVAKAMVQSTILEYLPATAIQITFSTSSISIEVPLERDTVKELMLEQMQFTNLGGHYEHVGPLLETLHFKFHDACMRLSMDMGRAFNFHSMITDPMIEVFLAADNYGIGFNVTYDGVQFAVAKSPEGIATPYDEGFSYFWNQAIESGLTR